MAYKIPAPKKSKDQNKFEVDIDVDVKGKTETRHFALPLMKYIKPSLMAEAEVMPGSSGYRHIINTVAPGLYDLFEEADQVNALMEAWREESGIGAGESSASSAS